MSVGRPGRGGALPVVGLVCLHECLSQSFVLFPSGWVGAGGRLERGVELLEWIRRERWV